MTSPRDLCECAAAPCPDATRPTRAVAPFPLCAQVPRAIPASLRPVLDYFPARYALRALDIMCSAPRTQRPWLARPLRAGISWSDATAELAFRSRLYFVKVRMRSRAHTLRARALMSTALFPKCARRSLASDRSTVDWAALHARRRYLIATPLDASRRCAAAASLAPRARPLPRDPAPSQYQSLILPAPAA